MDLQTKNFINLACDFRDYWTVDRNKNPLSWTQFEREQLIKIVSESEPEKFKRYGYYIENGLLYWSVNLCK